MTLPDRIPERLRRAAISLPEIGDGEGAWLRDDALKVLESLQGTPVAVCEVGAFEAAPWGYVPTGSGLSIGRLPRESDTDYAARSRAAATEFVQTVGSGSDDTLFALTFPMWKDAA